MDEATTPTQNSSEGVPPQAVERLKREREQAKAETEVAKAEVVQATQALTQAGFVDKLYEYLDGLEGNDRPSKPYVAAKFLARQLPADTEDIPAAVEVLRGELASLQPQNTLPPPPLMAGGPKPGAEAAEIETGPFRVGGKEYVTFISEYGRAATNAAIVAGQFFYSDENEAAQGTAELV